MSNGPTKSQTGELDTVKTTMTSFDIIEYLWRENGADLSGVADDLDLANSTAHRHLNTLLERGYLVKDGSEYCPSFRFLDIGDKFRQRKEEYDLVKGKVDELAERTEERVQFITEQNNQAVYVFKTSGERAVETDTHIGKHVPLNASAAGLAILASMRETAVEDVIQDQGLPKQTSRTIADRESLFEELDTIQDRGYSINDQGFTKGLRAIGAPITGPEGNTLGAISISGPINRLRDERLNNELPDILLGSINELELKIEYL